MRTVPLIAFVLAVTCLASWAGADDIHVYCVGTECGGAGPRRYAYRLDSFCPMMELRVGMNDLDSGSYTGVLGPPGWQFAVEPVQMHHMHGVMTPHDQISPGPCRCLTQGSVRWWTDDPQLAVTQFTFGYDHPWRAEDVGWKLDTLFFCKLIDQEDWAAPVGAGLGPVHGPCEPAVVDARITNASFDRGGVVCGYDTVTAMVLIENTGNVPWTFHVGASATQDGSLWFDFEPHCVATAPLAPGEIRPVHLSWMPPSDICGRCEVPPGPYDFYCRVYKHGCGPGILDDYLRGSALRVYVLPPCWSNWDCPFECYCQLPPGQCTGPGTCAQRPQICPWLYDPVCGCDGETYSNGCLAAVAGVNIAYDGPCDSDGDGVPDYFDLCPDTPSCATVDADGCPSDSDSDGVVDGCDQCPNTPSCATVDADGCPSDSDSDGVVDGCDQCPDTPSCATVDADGCPNDSDSDGVVDGCDQCPGTPDCATVDADGCPSDSDGDGVVDGCDQCPNTPDCAPVDTNGCPSDSDGDGVPDGCDICEGHDDNVDTDQDGVPNGCDLCAGADDLLDGDEDGVPDACDNCPDNANPDQADTDGNGVGDACQSPPAEQEQPQACCGTAGPFTPLGLAVGMLVLRLCGYRRRFGRTPTTTS